MVIALPLATLVVVTSVFTFLARSVRTTHLEVTHTTVVRSHVQRVLVLVLDAETGVRGYMLTGQAGFLQPYGTAQANLPLLLAALRRNVSASAAEQRLFAPVDQFAGRDMAILGQLRRMPPGAPVLHSTKWKLLAQGKAETDVLRGAIKSLSHYESGLLAAREKRSDNLQRDFLAAAIAAAVVGLLGGVVSIGLLTRSISRRIRAIESNADFLAAGLPLEPMDAAGDEIGHLALALERASGLLAERDATLSALFAASPDVIVMVDSAQRVMYASHAIRVVTGYDPIEWVGERMATCVHPDDAPALADAVASVAGEAAARLAMRARIRHASGRWVPVELHGQGVGPQYGAGEGVVVVMRDIADRERLEAGLVEAKLAAEDASAAKSTFLSRMSHELRTPLNAVLGFAQLLQLEGLDPVQAESVDQIVKGGRHLLDLINEILDISRIEAGHISLSMEPVDAQSLVEEVSDMLRPLAEQSSVSLLSAKPSSPKSPSPVPPSLVPPSAVPSASPACGGVSLLADRQRLRQVLVNLVANAVKYNRSGGRVEIGCEALPAGRACIRVRDTGLGIARDRLEDIFVPFERLDAEGSGVEGTGIGLSLARKLVDVMGGRLTVESEVGRGSTFSVEMQSAEAALDRFHRLRSLAASTDAGNEIDRGTGVLWSGSAGGHGERGDVDRDAAGAPVADHGLVLYIEDNPSNVQLVERVLEQRPGVQLLAASRGGVGLRLAYDRCPQLTLVDLHLPDMPGDKVVERLLRQQPCDGSAVAVLSADATPARASRLLEAGACEYLTKPLDVVKFLALVDSRLASTRQGPAGALR